MIESAHFDRSQTGSASHASEEARVEPTQLYDLAVLALVAHAPAADANADFGRCCNCGKHWPCTTIRLAARIRDGF